MKSCLSYHKPVVKLGNFLCLLSFFSKRTFPVSAALPPNFCNYDIADDDPQPYCVGEATPCSQLDITNCYDTEGCTIDGGIFAGLAGTGGGCTGTPANNCSDYHGAPLDCIGGIFTGCTPYMDPPCDMDPFDVAITPWLLAEGPAWDELICGELNTGVINGAINAACQKSRPSVDGLVQISFNTGRNQDGTEYYASCSLSVGGRLCQACDICENELAASFDCANALALDAVEGDNRCPDGTRCVGQDCSGNCICKSIQTITSAPSTPTPTPAPTPRQRKFLDAYTYTRYVKTGQETGWPNFESSFSNSTSLEEREFCDDCDDHLQRSNASCAPMTTLLIQDQCSAYTTSYGAVNGLSYDSNGTHICPTRYSIPCEPRTASRKCEQGLLLNSCVETSGVNVTTRELKDWCIVVEDGKQPTAEYTVPVLKRQIYNTLENCQTDQGIIREGFVPMNICRPHPVSVNGTLENGSIRTYCQSNEFISHYFSDSNCTVQSLDLDLFQRVSAGGECTEIFNFATASKGYTKESCSNLNDTEVIYCKPLYDYNCWGD